MNYNELLHELYRLNLKLQRQKFFLNKMSRNSKIYGIQKNNIIRTQDSINEVSEKIKIIESKNN